MKISHYANLAKLSLTDQEIATFEPQLQKILVYMDQLSQVDTTKVEPLLHPFPIDSYFGEDDSQPSNPLVTKRATNLQNHQYCVPPILGA